MKKSKKLVLLVASAVLSIAALSACSTGMISAKAVETEFTNQVTLASSYIVGETVSVPRAFLDVKGESKIAQKAFVRYPNGYYYELKFSGANATFKAETAGGYEVTYQAQYNGVMYTAKKEFCVEESLYSFGLSDSSASYIEKSDYYGNPSGLSVTLARNDTFKFNKKIDLNDFTRMDAILEMFPTPTVVGQRDYQNFCITLTDIYDSSNFVKINFNNPPTYWGDDPWIKMNTYTRAGAAGQAQIGFEGSTMHKNNQYGKYIPMSFDGYFWQVGEKTFPLYFDYANKILYNDLTSDIIVDLDDPTYQSYLWEGFTTGEVYVSMNMPGEGGSFFLKSLGYEDLSETSYIDDRGATIEVLTEYKTLPTGKVNVAYPVPDATATSSYGETRLTTKVFYNYGAENQVQFDVVDGKFMPIKTGTYTIVYDAKDKWGVINQVIYPAEIAENVPEINISIHEEEKVIDAYAGYEFTVADANVSGGTGNLNLIISAQNMNDGTTYEVKNGKFRPMSVGTYKIIYSCADYITVKTSSYEVNITADSKPVVIDEVYIPEFILKGTNITLPVLQAYDFSTGKAVLKDMEIWAIEGAVERKLDGNVLNSTAAVDEITIEYRLDGTVKTYTRDLISVGFENQELDLTKYFVGNATVTADKTKLTMTTNKNAYVKFANSVAEGYLTLDYGFTASSLKFKKVNVYLTDAKNSDIQLKVSYVKSGNNLSIMINDKDSVGTITPTSYDTRLKLSYNTADCSLAPLENQSLYIYKTVNGTDFKGFTSGLVYISFEFEGVTGTSEMTIYQLSNQTMRNTKYDIGFPQIVSSNSFVGRWELGTIMDIAPAVIADVLDTNLTAGLTIRTPSGEYAIAEDGTVLRNADPTKAYQLKLSECGYYNGKYTVLDGAENESSVPFSINVPDIYPPELTVNSKVEVTGNVGQKFELPTAVATDNLDEKLTISVLVMTPNHRTMLLEEGTTHIVPSYTGVYTITYTVYDAAGNLTIKTIYLTVE